ncbi:MULTISPECIES: LssY C-terminal domain-containing protein [Vibrio]|nr:MULTISPECIES: LssY C-terminal domain-containing protein [Vibrio]MBT0011096.1 LssY C-terminal domain-containing protein [Vibrio alginolyticus]MCZ2802467.1 LssY C-terminal domain-containing protein [Vibrio alginolyticus]MDW2193030.1 LssY C-terminal domain-containing protein [Vibrio sp. 1641]
MVEGASLFIGALLDALIGPNLFIPGEPFMLAAGHQLQQGIITGVMAVFLGGFLGDQLSFMIGKRIGGRSQRKLIQWRPGLRRHVARCRYLLWHKGNYVLSFARLLGPLAWVVPFIAGSQNIDWRRFTLFSTIGLLLGVGQFVALGYIASIGIKKFPLIEHIERFVLEHQLSLFVLASCVIFYLIGRKLKWRFMFTKLTMFFFVSALYVNYAHFFFRADDHQELYQSKTTLMAMTEVSLSNLNLKVYPGKSLVFDAQAINVMYIGEHPREIMEELGWIENKTFSWHELEVTDYLQLLKKNTPPVSDLFWNNVPQELAFQLPGSLLKRSHIRWWQAGIDMETNKKIWVGALSYDNGLSLTPYSGIVTILHRVNPDVDKERDKLAQQLRAAVPSKKVALINYSKPVALDENHDYFTDGRVLVIQEEL